MKKLALIIGLLIGISSFGQSSGSTDTTKMQVNNYWHGFKYPALYAWRWMEIPQDTTFTKYGIARKGSVLYVGNGSYWTAAGGGADANKVKVSSNDASAGYLYSKINVGGAISKETVADGDGNEQVALSLDTTSISTRAWRQKGVDSLAAFIGSHYVPLIVITGESNAGGYGLLSDTLTGESAPKSSVQILNNNTMTFQDLQIGVNNLLNHKFLPDNATVGMEIKLADFVSRFGTSRVYLLKAGMGGSTISEWSEIGGTGYYDSLTKRLDTAIAIIRRSGKEPQLYFWYTQGINDGINTDAKAITWANRTMEYFTVLRRKYGRFPIVFPRFDGLLNGTTTNPYLEHVVYNSLGVYTFSTSGYGARDVSHWSTAGFRTMDTALVRYSVDSVGVNEAYLKWQEKAFSKWYSKPKSYLTYTTYTNTAQSGDYVAYTSGGTPSGAVNTTAINNLRNWEIVLDRTNVAADEDAIVFYLDDESGTNFAWNSGNTYVLGWYTSGGSNYLSIQGGSTVAANPFTVPSSGAYKLKMSKSNNDVAFSISYDGGVTYNLVYIYVGALTGKTSLYAKVLFAAPAAGQKIKVLY